MFVVSSKNRYTKSTLRLFGEGAASDRVHRQAIGLYVNGLGMQEREEISIGEDEYSAVIHPNGFSVDFIAFFGAVLGPTDNSLQVAAPCHTKGT